MQLFFRTLTLIPILMAANTAEAVEYLLFPLHDKVRVPSKIGKENIDKIIEKQIVIENLSGISGIQIELYDGQTALLPSKKSITVTFKKKKKSNDKIIKILKEPESTKCFLETSGYEKSTLLSKVKCYSAAVKGRSRVEFEENFDSPLDPSKWGIDNNVPRRDAVNVQNAFEISQGIGQVRIFSEAGKHYTAFLNTSTRYTPIYGFYEAKIMMKPASGSWCAFWLQQNLGNKTSSKTLIETFGDSIPPEVAQYDYGPEIDITEVRRHYTQGQNAGNVSNGAIHTRLKGGEMKAIRFSKTDPSGIVDKWHTFGVDWKPDKYDLYYDGQLYKSIGTDVSHAPSQILLTCEIQDNNWAGRIPANGYNLADDYGMKIDWLRVWR